MRLTDGRTFDAALYQAVRDEELARLGGHSSGRLADAADLLDETVLSDTFVPFITIPAAERLDHRVPVRGRSTADLTDVPDRTP